MPADLLGSSDDVLRPEGLVGRCEDGYDEFEDPARPWRGRRWGSSSLIGGFEHDGRSDLGQTPKLNHDFGV